MLRNKLHSDSGATILLALLFFLLCSVAGAVVLAAGSQAAGRISSLAESEQDFYTVTSAVQTVSAEIEGVEFQYITDMSSEGTEYSYPEEPDGNLSVYLTEMSKTVYENKTPVTKEFTIYPASSTEKETFGTVKAVATMDLDYNIEFLFTIDGSSRYQCTLQVKAVNSVTEGTYEREASDGTPINVNRTTTHVYWNECIIDKS